MSIIPLRNQIKSIWFVMLSQDVYDVTFSLHNYETNDKIFDFPTYTLTKGVNTVFYEFHEKIECPCVCTLRAVVAENTDVELIVMDMET
jgi:hypothetical protein